jgi:hypothetical protein
MVFGGFKRGSIILDMEDDTKSCSDVEPAPVSPAGSNSQTSGVLNGMPVLCNYPNDHTSPSLCHIYKNHTWQFLASLPVPTIRHHAPAINIDDNHLWIMGGETTSGKDDRL